MVVSPGCTGARAGARAHRWCRAAGWGSEIVPQNAAWGQGGRREGCMAGCLAPVRECWGGGKSSHLHKMCQITTYITWPLSRAWARGRFWSPGTPKSYISPMGNTWCVKASFPCLSQQAPLKILPSCKKPELLRAGEWEMLCLKPLSSLWG